MSGDEQGNVFADGERLDLVVPVNATFYMPFALSDFVYDSNGNQVLNADGTPQTTPRDITGYTISFAISRKYTDGAPVLLAAIVDRVNGSGAWAARVDVADLQKLGQGQTDYVYDQTVLDATGKQIRGPAGAFKLSKGVPR